MDKIKQIKQDIQQVKTSNAGFLSVVKKKIEKIENILKKYDELKLLIKRYTSLFVTNTDDFYSFLNSLEDKF
jgi:DNA repair exonuclease SbcCD ATPase subunit